jgi:hypothetical protein
VWPKGRFPTTAYYYEEYGLLGCNVVQFRETTTFQKKISPPPSGRIITQARNQQKLLKRYAI